MLRRILRRDFSGTEMLVLLVAVMAGFSIMAQAVSLPNTFVPGDTARATEVNENFAALTDAVTNLEAMLADLESTLSTLTPQVDSLESTVSSLETEILDLATQVTEIDDRTQFMSVETSELAGLAGPHVIFDGVNVHVRSGSGATDDSEPIGGTLRGLGNLVIGYNEPASDQTADDRAGSHNLVVGREHKFLKYAGIVTGRNNIISGVYASVTGGRYNTASGQDSSVSGGGGAVATFGNEASGNRSSVSGGSKSTAAGNNSSISGGEGHQVDGFNGSISGGRDNLVTAVADFGTVSGGRDNIASTDIATVGGGAHNTAAGPNSTVSGGQNVTITETFGWGACGLSCP